jgi:uncharacterized RDD family membrane protein YckC
MTQDSDPNMEQDRPSEPPPTAPPSMEPPPTAAPPTQGPPTAAPPTAAPPAHSDLPQAPPLPPGYGYGEPGAEVVAAGMYRDAESGLTLPQGVQLASVGRRIGAYFLAIPLFIVTLGIGYIIWGLIAWANGQTPTYQVLGMRCWRPDDNRIAGWWWMALREIIGRLVEGILGIITELISFILMCTRPDRKAIHDLIAGTVVLHDPNKVLGSRTA